MQTNHHKHHKAPAPVAGTKHNHNHHAANAAPARKATSAIDAADKQDDASEDQELSAGQASAERWEDKSEQEYDEAGYKKDWDTEWDSHKHSHYPKKKHTPEPRSCASHAGAGVVVLAALALF